MLSGLVLVFHGASIANQTMNKKEHTKARARRSGRSSIWAHSHVGLARLFKMRSEGLTLPAIGLCEQQGLVVMQLETRGHPAVM